MILWQRVDARGALLAASRIVCYNAGHCEFNAILDEPAMKARIAELGGVSMKGTPADFGKTIADETAKWEKVVKFAGVKIE